MSFNPTSQRDIRELATKIDRFKAGAIDEDRFKHYRLTRGVYGQRQLGVHMFRTKIPFGKLTADQLIGLADASEKYTNGNLHLTTRQNIQFHYVKLDDAVGVWNDLAAVGVTAMEACGNTVRNVTGSARAGIDPNELFDVAPYVQATFEYFLQNPISRAMGRKIKIAFSSSDADSAFTYFHDFGFIPRLREENGEQRRGFKVVVAGGLGAQSMVAHEAFDFLPEEEIIPFMEAAIRVFDRYGEREKRMKARMKFLVKKLGYDGWFRLVMEEKKVLANQTVWVDRNLVSPGTPPPLVPVSGETVADFDAYELWSATNVFAQKQAGFFGVWIKLPLGNIDAARTRRFAEVVRRYAADDVRLTVNQGMLLRFVRPEHLPALYNQLRELGLARPGFDSLADVTACPGTDTCNLGVTNSTGLAAILEKLIEEEYPEYLRDQNLKIKISGCMNACGQHMAADIGLHGSSIKKRPLVIPAMQIVLGGGVDATGQGFVADRVIKIPTRQVPAAVRALLDDFEQEAQEGEYFRNYYQRQGKNYFYQLLKPLAEIDPGNRDLLFDWGENHEYLQAIGVGECAGVAYDMIGSIINDQRERLELARESFDRELWADGIYHAYTAFVTGAKALLLSADIKCNTQKKILQDFETEFGQHDRFARAGGFESSVLRMKKESPTGEFALRYFADSEKFYQTVLKTREEQLADEADRPVILDYYKA